MKFIVDTSVLIAVVTHETGRARLIEETVGATLLTPMSVHWEVGNAFSAMLKRGRISVAEAHRAIEAYEEIPLRFIDVALADALSIADELEIYAYDAYVIAAAEKQRCPLISLDRGLCVAARQRGTEVMELE